MSCENINKNTVRLVAGITVNRDLWEIPWHKQSALSCALLLATVIWVEERNPPLHSGSIDN
jgi:hypothetical protein